MNETELIKNQIFNNNIEGAFVECGVHEGYQQIQWINIIISNNLISRDIYLYDTFSGLVEPSKYDYTCENAKIFKMNEKETYEYWRKQIINSNINNWCYAPLDNVKYNLYSTGYPQDKLHFIEGNTIQTLKIKENIPEKIAILRLDTDWYESSKAEIEALYNNVVVGGLIIFDDYYHWDGQRRAIDEYFKSINITYDFIKINNDKTGAIIKK
jgi:O-methyltransferase